MKLLFVGDVMLGRLVNEELKSRPAEFPWGNTLPIFSEADCRVGNLECVISDRGTPWHPGEKEFHFRTDGKNIAALKAAGFDAVSIANNHSLDYGEEALLEMLQILDRAKIARAGAGRDSEEASHPAFFHIGGVKIGMIAFTDNEPSWEAKPRHPGVFYVPVDLHDHRAQKLFELIAAAKKKTDFLIVSAHWGPNWGYRPQPHHPPFAHRAIDAGADLFFGHSGHVFQGIEIHQGRPILYCAGDFVDDYAVDPLERNDRSFIYTMSMKDRSIQGLQLYPTVIRDFQAQLAQHEEAKAIAAKMRDLCGELKTASVWNTKGNCLKINSSIRAF